MPKNLKNPLPLGRGSRQKFEEAYEHAGGITAAAKNGFAFENWTDASGNVVSANANFNPKLEGYFDKGITAEKYVFTAHFKKSNNSTPVYVYAKIQGVEEITPEIKEELKNFGLEVNNSGIWATVGRISNVNIPTATSGIAVKEEYIETAKNAFGSIEYYKPEIGRYFDQSLITGYSLSVADGADSYPSAPSDAWHLDCTFDVSKCRYTVNYFDLDGNHLSTPQTHLAPMGTVVEAGKYKKEIAGYFYHHADPESITISRGNNERTINLYYAKLENAIIEYRVDGDTGSISTNREELHPLEGVAQGSVATPKTGYKFVNWTDEEGNVVGTEPEYIPQKNEAGDFESAVYTAHFAEANEVVINYVVKDKGGSVSVDTEILLPLTGQAEGSIAKADPDYRFVNWTDAEGNVVSSEEQFVPGRNELGLYQDATYYANFEYNPPEIPERPQPDEPDEPDDPVEPEEPEPQEPEKPEEPEPVEPEKPETPVLPVVPDTPSGPTTPPSTPGPTISQRKVYPPVNLPDYPIHNTENSIHYEAQSPVVIPVTSTTMNMVFAVYTTVLSTLMVAFNFISKRGKKLGLLSLIPAAISALMISSPQGKAMPLVLFDQSTIVMAANAVVNVAMMMHSIGKLDLGIEIEEEESITETLKETG